MGGKLGLARDALHDGDAASAVTILEAEFARRPKHVETRLLLALAWERTKVDPQRRLDLLEETSSLAPDRAQVHELTARALLEQKQPDSIQKAVDLLWQALEIEPSHRGVYSLLSRLLQREDPEGAFRKLLLFREHMARVERDRALEAVSLRRPKTLIRPLLPLVGVAAMAVLLLAFMANMRNANRASVPEELVVANRPAQSLPPADGPNADTVAELADEAVMDLATPMAMVEPNTAARTPPPTKPSVPTAPTKATPAPSVPASQTPAKPTLATSPPAAQTIATLLPAQQVAASPPPKPTIATPAPTQQVVASPPPKPTMATPVPTQQVAASPPSRPTIATPVPTQQVVASPPAPAKPVLTTPPTKPILATPPPPPPSTPLPSPPIQQPSLKATPSSVASPTAVLASAPRLTPTLVNADRANATVTPSPVVNAPPTAPPPKPSPAKSPSPAQSPSPAITPSPTITPSAAVVAKADDLLSQQSLTESATVSETAIAEFVESWRLLWQGSLPNYFDCYGRAYSWSGGDLKAWVTYKQNIFSRDPPKSVELSNLRVEKSGAGWQVSFDQTYKSAALSDRGRKTLKLVRQDGQLRIVEETWRALPAPLVND